MTELSDLKQEEITTVREFLSALECDAVDEALELVTGDVLWINTSLPTVRGIDALRRALELGPTIHLGFEAHIHQIASDDNVVLTERTDVLRFGPVRVAFWVCGTFELRDGKIAIWHDHFSWGSILRGAAVGIIEPLLPRRRLAFS